MPNFLFLFGGSVALIATFVFGSLSIIFSYLGRSMGFIQYFSRSWARWILIATRTKVTIEGLENLPPAPVILIGNHQGAFDILALLGHVPNPPVFVAKHTLFKIPVFGTAMGRIGHIPVDRTNREKAVASINKGAQKLRDNNLNVVFFPEGTRTRDGELLPFKKGAFMFALQSGLPVVPFVLTGSFETMPPGQNKVYPGDIKVRFLPPMETSKYTLETRQEFMDDAKSIILAALADEQPVLGSKV